MGEDTKNTRWSICDMCNKYGDLHEKRYYYAIKCECHEDEHCEVVYHCENCTPLPPFETTIVLKPREE